MRTIVLTLVLLSSLGSMAAQSSQPLSLEACIERATRESVEVQSRQLQTEQSKIQLSSRKNAFLPMLSAGMSQNFDFGRSADKTGVMQDRSSAGSSFSLSGGVTLFSGFSRLNELKAARLRLEAVRADLDQAKWDVRMQVTQLYFALLYAERVETLTGADRDYYQRYLDHAQQMVQGGKWSADKVAEAEAQLATSQLRYVEAQNGVAQARTDLMQILELPSDAPFAIEPIDIEGTIAQAASAVGPWEDTYETARQLLPAYRSLDASVRAASKQVASARAGYMPTLNLSAGYSNSYYYLMGDAYQGLNLPFREQWRQNGRSYIGLSLSIHIFDAFRTRSAIRSAKLELNSLAIQRVQQDKKLRKEVEQATLTTQLALRKIEASETSLKANETAHRFAEERWQAGRATSNELYQAAQRQLNSQFELANAKYELALRLRLLALYRGQAL